MKAVIGKEIENTEDFIFHKVRAQKLDSFKGILLKEVFSQPVLEERTCRGGTGTSGFPLPT